MNGSKLGVLGRVLGAPSYLTQQQSNWFRHGAKRNFYSGEATVVGGASIASKAAIPSGYVHPVAWVLAPKPGGMVSRALIRGTGDIPATNLAGGLNADAALDGAGDITNAALGLIASAVADLTGSATLAADILGKLDASADLSGSGDITAAMSALSDLVAALSGSGQIDSTSILDAKGALSADIVVTGELLSTANVGAAVWQYLIENGYSAEEILRIIVSAAAGKVQDVDLAPGSPIRFRNLADTKDRITSTVDANDNRDTVIIDATE